MKAIKFMFLTFLASNVVGFVIYLTTDGFIPKPISLSLMISGLVLSGIFHIIFKRELRKEKLKNVQWAYFYLLLSLSLAIWPLFLMRY